ncbi:24320_t:CDS:2 [Cetraspora pellucida]|uniref:24320_t:CDS:1 n=1 Tax=Cetraspora pellucida TaxID=1433469 RepID=A0A9N9C9Y4_9GLOM|nr:24320_t:CDS:2 [Cetraspora pellucida]
MSTDTITRTPIILWCWVRGSTSIFDITVGRDNRVSKLKEVIKEKRKPRFDGFASDELKLLKLKNPVNDERISDVQNLTLQGNEDENDDVSLMKDMRKIATYWPENQAPHEDLIHVIVEAPDLAKQPTADLVSALKNLDGKVDLMRTELGNVYEISARLEIAKISGSHYSSKFEISGLNGLVRLSLPRKKFSNENPKYDSQIYIQVYRADKLANHIYHKNMRKKLEESISYIRSLPQNNNFIKNLNTLSDNAVEALEAWKAYEKKSAGSSQNRLFLANTEFLGVMLITSYIMDPKIAIENAHAPFNKVLELDVRGRPTSYDMKKVSIEIGEIKLTTKNLHHGYRQLLIRLASLGFVIEALNSKDGEVGDYRCDLVGILYVPKVPSIDIPNEWEDGIKFPERTKHTIRIVANSFRGIDNYNFAFAQPWDSSCPICDRKHGNCGLHGECYKMEQNIVLLASLQAINSNSRS